MSKLQESKTLLYDDSSPISKKFFNYENQGSYLFTVPSYYACFRFIFNKDILNKDMELLHKREIETIKIQNEINRRDQEDRE